MRTETFQTPGDASLRIRVPAGRIDIETAEGEETRVELSSDPAVEDAAVIRARGSEVTVEIDEKRVWGFIRSAPEVDVRVVCPPRARLEVKSVSADVDVHGVVGPSEVKNVSGDVEIERVEGDLAVKSVSGDVAADAVTGRTTLQTVSGDVRVDDAGGPVTVQTVSGDQHLGAVAQGAVTLKSVSGDMHVGIRPGSSLWIDAKSVSGDTTSDLPIGDTPPEGDGPLIELRATAMSGDIEIVRAD
ncbi:MAG TPA: DUF4097 family beta strand repeat-containing protein [Gaiellaceae bacterium]|jgi:hypothetical protein|nr:DUF4097 family beta strand repeat-containing protein [Gaiellaceae bacterium]